MSKYIATDRDYCHKRFDNPEEFTNLQGFNTRRELKQEKELCEKLINHHLSKERELHNSMEEVNKEIRTLEFKEQKKLQKLRTQKNKLRVKIIQRVNRRSLFKKRVDTIDERLNKLASEHPW